MWPRKNMLTYYFYILAYIGTYNIHILKFVYLLKIFTSSGHIYNLDKKFVELVIWYWYNRHQSYAKFRHSFVYVFFRISVIFRVKSAKAVKITDMDLIKRLGIIIGIFVLGLLIRTLVSPPVVIVGKLKLIPRLIFTMGKNKFCLRQQILRGLNSLIVAMMIWDNLLTYQSIHHCLKNPSSPASPLPNS